MYKISLKNKSTNVRPKISQSKRKQSNAISKVIFTYKCYIHYFEYFYYVKRHQHLMNTQSLLQLIIFQVIYQKSKVLKH